MIVFFFFYTILVIWNMVFGILKKRGHDDGLIGVYCMGNVVLGIILLNCIPF